MGDIAIRVEGLSKRYRIGERQRYKSLRDSLANAVSTPFKAVASTLNGRRSRRCERPYIWALKDVSFEVKQGEVVGIIGRNGAGKSTLLKILSRITEPTEGHAEIHGRVGSLLEVGTGFHPELTGRENTYLNGAILGMKKAEIDRKFDEIVAFAEIEKFINTPVKHYSSGMYVRLAFAVAAHLETEILLVDEVLAVGDMIFQKKCLGKMGEVAKEGRTILFVSHNMAAISTLCQRIIVLEEGNRVFDGLTSMGIRKYLSRLGEDVKVAEWIAQNRKDLEQKEDISICALRVMDKDSVVRGDFSSQEDIIIEMDIYWNRWIPYLRIGFDIETDSTGLLFRTWHNDISEPLSEHSFLPGLYRFRAEIPKGLLNSNVYYVTPAVAIHRKKWLYRKERPVQFKVEYETPNSTMLVRNRPGTIAPLISWQGSHLKG